MFSWTQVVGGRAEYASDVVLFTVNPTTGKLTNTKKVVANFGLSDSWWTAMAGMTSMGTVLRFASDLVRCCWVDYYESSINPTTGALGTPFFFWQDDQTSTTQVSVFADTLTAQVNVPVSKISSISIYRKAASPFTCYSSMVSVCGDIIYPFPVHPSKAYLFVKDYTLNEVSILYINLISQQLVASRASIPGEPQIIAYSPDGLLVYAVEKSHILTYVFNPHSGLLTARTTIKAPGVWSILPWK
jgi:hypothetical protein